jgi:radical SAM superfamily enzyme YgiQ (UPF0313 family)
MPVLLVNPDLQDYGEYIHPLVTEYFGVYEEYAKHRRLRTYLRSDGTITDETTSEPTGLLLVAAVLHDAGIDTTVLDLNLIGAQGGSADEELRRELAAGRHAVIGLSFLYFYLYEQIVRLARLCRSACPDALLVLGGNSAAALPSHDPLNQLVDVIVDGEGESAFLSLCQAIVHEADGDAERLAEVAVRPRRAAAASEWDIVSAPRPARHLYPLDALYRVNDGRSIMFASRGCPYKCSFCDVPQFWKSRIRYRRVEDVVDEFLALGDAGARLIHIYDLNFGVNRRWTLDLLRRMAAERVQVPWDALMSVRVLADQEFLTALAEAYCVGFMVGIESTDKANLQEVNGFVKFGAPREEPMHILRSGLAAAVQAGLLIETTYVFGLPGDSESSMVRTAHEIAQLYADDLLSLVGPMLFTPFPGTEIGDRPDRFGVEIVNRDYRDYTLNPRRPVCSTRHVAARRVFELWELAIVELIDVMRARIGQQPVTSSNLGV